VVATRGGAGWVGKRRGGDASDMLEHTCRLPAEHVPAGPARARTAALSRFRRRRAGECTKTRAHGGAESRGGCAEADALLQSTLSRSALALLQSTLSHSALALLQSTLALLQSTLALPPRRRQASPSPSARHSLSPSCRRSERSSSQRARSTLVRVLRSSGLRMRPS
jgi:hypothetical protein